MRGWCLSVTHFVSDSIYNLKVISSISIVVQYVTGAFFMSIIDLGLKRCNIREYSELGAKLT
jgi:hypothetical protein